MKYQGQQLKKYKNKSGGKNLSDIDGFYQNESGHQYLIKQPKDKKELFTELFAGLLLKEFMSRGLVDEIYHPSLIICANVIEVKEGSYALIQDVAAFEELYKIIGTGNRDKSDRDPLLEMILGPSYYPALTQKGEYFGLSTALMFSLLLGANSVHSANIVVLLSDENKALKQFARLDWGDAFRYFCSELNNKDVLNPEEYQGGSIYKKFSKGYIFNYKYIAGLFPAIAKKGNNLKTALIMNTSEDDQKSPLVSIVKSALAKIPEVLLDSETQKELANYLRTETFKKTTFGPCGSYDDFALELSKVLHNRLEQITKLTDIVAPVKKDVTLYKSTIKVKPIKLSVDPTLAFPDLLQNWLKQVAKPNQNFDIDTIDWGILAGKFNFYLNSITQQTDMVCLWGSDSSNIFTPYYGGKEKAPFGYAFVPECRESTIMRVLFYIVNDKLYTNRPVVYEKATNAYKQKNPRSSWAKIDNLFTSALGVISMMKTIKELESDKRDIELLSTKKSELRKYIIDFSKAKELVENLLKNRVLIQSDDHGKTSFYPISQEALFKMNGNQLVTICLEEFTYTGVTPLLAQIMKNDILWGKMQEVSQSGDFKDRVDNPVEKMNQLIWLRASITPTLKKNESLQKELIFNKKVLKETTQNLSKKIKEITICNNELKKKNQAEFEMKSLKLKLLADENSQNYEKLLLINASQKTRSKQVALLQILSGRIEELAKREFSKKSEKYKNAMEIVNGLRDKSKQYTGNSDYKLEDFQNDLTKLVNTNKKPLENHRGMNHLINNVLLAILLLGIGYLIAAGAKKVITGGSFTFFNDPTSCQQVKELESTIENISDCESSPSTGCIIELK